MHRHELQRTIKHQSNIVIEVKHGQYFLVKSRYESYEHNGGRLLPCRIGLEEVHDLLCQYENVTVTNGGYL